MKLQDEIKELLSLKREGGYWDFKQKWYSDKGELLLDVLCMANNQEDRDAYIIIGIQDLTWQVIGVKSDKCRMTLSSLSQFISGKKYAAYSPEIDLQEIELEGHTVDVIIVRNTMHTPYYLIEKYKDPNPKLSNSKEVKAGKVYVRLNDHKAGVGSCEITPYYCLQHLWGKHFGCGQSIMKRLNILLDDPKQWKCNWGNIDYAYHMEHPEFRIQQVEDWQDDWCPAAAFYTAPKMYSSKLNIMYHNTIIYETRLCAFDDFGKYLPKASISYLNENSDFWYSYYQMDTINGKMLRIFTGKNLNISTREPNYYQFLIFKNENERIVFIEYFAKHFNQYTDDQIKKQYKYQIAKDIPDNGGGLAYSAFHVAKAAMIYQDWLKVQHL